MGFLGLGKGPYYYKIVESRSGDPSAGEYFTRYDKKYYASDIPGEMNEIVRWHGKWTNRYRQFRHNQNILLFVRRLSRKELKELGVKK